LAALQNTGMQLGRQGAQVWRDPSTGDRWLVKKAPAFGEFLPDLQVAVTKIQQRAGLPAAETHRMMLNGRPVNVQRMFDADPAFPDDELDPSQLSQPDIVKLQKHMVLDWLISNHYVDTGSFLRDRHSGEIQSIGKTQAFGYFPTDPPTLNFGDNVRPPLRPNNPVYSTMWRYFRDGLVILQDPRTGELGEFIRGVQEIPDGEYEALLRPYAESAAGSWAGQLSMRRNPEAFLQAAVDRKNNLMADMGALYDEAITQTAGPHTSPPQIAAEQIETVEEYTNGAYAKINGHLRPLQPIDPEFLWEDEEIGIPHVVLGDWIAAIDHVLASLPPYRADPFDTESTTYRGLSATDSLLAQMQVGSTFRDLAYFSTSTAVEVATECSYPIGEGVPVVITVIGRSGVDISHLGRGDEEGEVLYPRGTEFEVISREWRALDEWSSDDETLCIVMREKDR
jgi:hypothetical protein